MIPLFRRRLPRREKDRKRGIRGEHTARVVAAKRNDRHCVAGAVLLVHIICVNLAARETRCACAMAGQEESNRQDVEFAEQVHHWPDRKLFLQLVVAEVGGIPVPVLDPVRPAVLSGAVTAIGVGTKAGTTGHRPGRVQIRVARRVRNHLGHRNVQRVVDLV